MYTILPELNQNGQSYSWSMASWDPVGAEFFIPRLIHCPICPEPKHSFQEEQTAMI